MFQDSHKMEVGLFSATCFVMRVSEGNQFEEPYQWLRILLSRRRRVVHRKHLEARTRGPSLPEMSSMTIEIWQFLLEM